MTAAYEFVGDVPDRQRTTGESANTARECDLGNSPDRQVRGALAADRSESQASAQRPSEDLNFSPGDTGAITCYPWEGYFQDDEPVSPAPSPSLETFLSNLMFGE